MWFEKTTFYQIYPLGFCGAPPQNDDVEENRIQKVTRWIPHLQKLGAGAVLFNPVFASDAHGYDTRCFTRIDNRLGTNDDFAAVCKALRAAGIRVVLDGVFNHVGRGFWAFQDVLKNRENSLYKDWFILDFGRQSSYGDSLWYEGWEGHFDLVKLNLHNPQVVQHILNAVGGWIDTFGIDGIRLDVAYLLHEVFLQKLRSYVNSKKADFFLVGEMIHGDYNTMIGPDKLDSATNYECYKGLYSSFNSLNMFEIAYSLNRQFGPEDWTLYRGLPLLNFADNHDVTRLATMLKDKAHLPLLYGLMFGMPGVPCLYYGSEWGAEGGKRQGDAALRPAFDVPVENDLFATLAKLCAIRASAPALAGGSYRQVYLTNPQFIFERSGGGQRLLVAVNAANAEHVAHFDAGAGTARDLLTGQMADFGGGYRMPPLSVQFLEMEK
ncbi:MAG: maltodextrin glucosidase [Ruminococcaceae bacterium]|nr:maltodextrin glucosidase [Oscillospiraceae bacterium]